MGVQEIRSVIARSAAELQAAGIEALYVFGSQARGEAGDYSDIDLMFDVAPDRLFSLIDQGRMQSRLEELLHSRVDFVSRNGLRPRMRQRVEAEMIRLL